MTFLWPTLWSCLLHSILSLWLSVNLTEHLALTPSPLLPALELCFVLWHPGVSLSLTWLQFSNPAAFACTDPTLLLVWNTSDMVSYYLGCLHFSFRAKSPCLILWLQEFGKYTSGYEISHFHCILSLDY